MVGKLLSIMKVVLTIRTKECQIEGTLSNKPRAESPDYLSCPSFLPIPIFNFPISTFLFSAVFLKCVLFLKSKSYDMFKHFKPKKTQCYQTLLPVDGQDASGIVNAVETINYCVDNVKSRAKEFNKKHELNKRHRIHS